MRLSTEDLRHGWRHPRRLVRDVVASYFEHSFTADSATTREATASVEEFGWRGFLSWGYKFTRLPLVDDTAFAWVCEQAERTDEGAPTDDLKWHLASMLVNAEIGGVERHRSRLLALPPLLPEQRQDVLLRLELTRLSPDEAWRRLEAHCEAATQADTFAAARVPAAERLLEPLTRAGDAIHEKILDVLRKPPRLHSENSPDEWLTGLMITLAGRLRIEQATPFLWDLMQTEWDWYIDEAAESLTRIGTSGVVRQAWERYRGMSSGGRIAATDLWANVRGDDAGAAIEDVLGIEDDDFLRAQLGRAAAAQFDERLMPLARAVHDEAPDDPERGEIRELLVAFSYLAGWDLPEREDWEREADATSDRLRSLSTLSGSDLRSHFGLLLDDDDDGDGDFTQRLDEGDDESRPPLQRGAQVGRNEPCPCGSGKKYKKCCLAAGPGPRGDQSGPLDEAPEP
jgi:hypothetical protein